MEGEEALKTPAGGGQGDRTLPLVKCCGKLITATPQRLPCAYPPTVCAATADDKGQCSDEWGQ